MGEVLVTEPDSYVSALLLLFAIAPCWSLERSVWSHPEQTKTESNVSVFWWPEESDDVTSHAVLSSTSPSVVTLTGFTLSTTVLNWQKESVRKVAPREVYFCIVSYLRQIRSLRKFKASRFLLTELKSSPSLWWSWGPHRWQVLRCWLYTREQFSHIRNSISDVYV